MKAREFTPQLLKTAANVKDYAKAYASYVSSKSCVLREMLDLYNAIMSQDCLFNEDGSINEEIFPRDYWNQPIKVKCVEVAGNLLGDQQDYCYVDGLTLATALNGVLLNDSIEEVTVPFIQSQYSDAAVDVCKAWQPDLDWESDDVCNNITAPFNVLIIDHGNNDEVLCDGRDISISNRLLKRCDIVRPVSSIPEMKIDVVETLFSISQDVSFNTTLVTSLYKLGSSNDLNMSDLINTLRNDIGSKVDELNEDAQQIISVATDQSIPVESRISSIVSFITENVVDESDKDMDNGIYDDSALQLTFMASDFTGTSASAMWNGASASNAFSSALCICGAVCKAAIKVVVTVLKAAARLISRLWKKFITPAIVSKDFVKAEGTTSETFCDVPVFQIGGVEDESRFKYDPLIMARLVKSAFSEQQTKNYNVEVTKAITVSDSHRPGEIPTLRNAYAEDFIMSVESSREVEQHSAADNLVGEIHTKNMRTDGVMMPINSACDGYKIVRVNNDIETTIVDRTMPYQAAVNAELTSFHMEVVQVPMGWRCNSLTELRAMRQDNRLLIYNTAQGYSLAKSFIFNIIDQSVTSDYDNVWRTLNSLPYVSGNTATFSLIFQDDDEHEYEVRIAFKADYIEMMAVWSAPQSIRITSDHGYVDHQSDVSVNIGSIVEGKTHEVTYHYTQDRIDRVNRIIEFSGFSGFQFTATQNGCGFTGEVTKFDDTVSVSGRCDTSVSVINYIARSKVYMDDGMAYTISLIPSSQDGEAQEARSYVHCHYHTSVHSIEAIFRLKQTGNAYFVLHGSFRSQNDACTFPEVTFSDRSYYNGNEDLVESEWDVVNPDGISRVIWNSIPMETLSDRAISNLMADVNNVIDKGTFAVSRFAFGAIQIGRATTGNYVVTSYLTPIDWEKLLDDSGNWLTGLDQPDQLLTAIGDACNFTSSFEYEEGDLQAYKCLYAAYKVLDLLLWCIRNPERDLSEYFNTPGCHVLATKTWISSGKINNRQLVDLIFTNSCNDATANSLTYMLLFQIISNKTSFMRVYFLMFGTFPDFYPYLIGDALGSPLWHISTDEDIQKYVDKVVTAVVVAAIAIAAAVVIGVAAFKLKKALRKILLKKNRKAMDNQLTTNRLNARQEQIDKDVAKLNEQLAQADSDEARQSILDRIQELGDEKLNNAVQIDNLFEAAYKNSRSIARWTTLQNVLFGKSKDPVTTAKKALSNADKQEEGDKSIDEVVINTRALIDQTTVTNDTLIGQGLVLNGLPNLLGNLGNSIVNQVGTKKVTINWKR